MTYNTFEQGFSSCTSFVIFLLERTHLPICTCIKHVIPSQKKVRETFSTFFFTTLSASRDKHVTTHRSAMLSFRYLPQPSRSADNAHTDTKTQSHRPCSCFLRPASSPDVRPLDTKSLGRGSRDSFTVEVGRGLGSDSRPAQHNVKKCALLTRGTRF